jgi:FkbM family methyltransferase
MPSPWASRDNIPAFLIFLTSLNKNYLYIFKNNIMELLKKIVFAVFPGNLLTKIKKYHYYHKLKNSKISEEEDLSMLEKIVKPNSIVLDIGANVGLYTKFLSGYVGENGKVLSFEPVNETYNYLKNNIQKLGLSNVIPINAALSDKNGKALMQVPNFSDNRKNFYEAAITEKPDKNLTHFEVETQTIDDVCNQYFMKPSFIKCDVEGHEWFVIKGADSVISGYKPILFIEINQELTNADLNTINLLDYLSKKGYVIFINENNRLKRRESEKRVNYYFLTEEHMKNLSEIIMN